jgi:hypothetical protein
MSINMPALDNPLESVINQLRDLCGDREVLRSPSDAASVGRMLVHITNINASVLASTEDHANAAKRLNDFAFTLSRMARGSELDNEALTSRLTAVANDLRAASEELARGNTVPNWRAPIAAPSP